MRRPDRYISDGGVRKVRRVWREDVSRNNKRVQRQKGKDIRVIVSNPPYSAQQESENDNNQNLITALDERISETYAADHRQVKEKRVRLVYAGATMASDRIRDEGIVGCNQWILHKQIQFRWFPQCVADEFSASIASICAAIKDVRELSRQEGGKIFGSAVERQWQLHYL